MLLIVALAFVLLVFVLEWANSEMTEEPPNRYMERIICDEEFLAACPIKNTELALRIRRIIADQTGMDEHHIHPNDRLITELKM